MQLNHVAKAMQRVTHSISKLLNGVGGWFLMVVTCLTGIDVFLRYIFQKPLTGTYEITEFVLCILVFCGLPYCASEDSNVRVTLFTRLLPARIQAILNSVVLFLSMSFVAVMAWMSCLQAFDYRRQHLITDILKMPVFPFLFVVSLGSLILLVVLFAKFMDSLDKAVNQ